MRIGVHHIALWRAGLRATHTARLRTDTHAYVARRFLADRPDPPKEPKKDEEQQGAPSPGAGEPVERSFTTSTSEAAAAMDKQPLPYLSRPLGVPGRPTSEKVSWSERHPEWYDRDARIAKRRMIVKEATRGYFHDFHEIRSHGGKTWRSPNTMIRHDKSLFFPDIQGTCLADRSQKHTSDMIFGKVSVVAMLTSKVSEEHTRSFYQATLDRFGDDPNFQLIQINLQENSLKAYLIKLFISTLRATVAPKLQSTYLLSAQNMDSVREGMGLHNKHVGYTYLVGPDGKIRWAGSAFAEPDESRALIACTAVLLDRLAGRRHSSRDQ